MKKYLVWILSLIFLNGCSGQSKELEAGMQLRAKILQASQCSFTAHITADYGDDLFDFITDSTADNTEALVFTIMEPATISGISGKLTASGGEIIFDDQVLQFPLEAENLPSPISAPWILMNTLRSGFLSSACREGESIRLSADCSYAGNDLRLDIWLNSNQLPQQVDILCEGRRFLTMNITDFVIS